MKNQFLKLATKITGKTEQEIQEKLFNGDDLNEDAADVLLSELETKISKAKGDQTESFNKGYAKAEAKFKGEAERKFAESTGLDIEDGETIETLIEKYKEANKPKKAAMPDDEVKKHPLYRALEKERVPKSEFDRVNAEFEQYKAQSARREVLGAVKPKVWSVVAGMNPILPKEQKVSETIKSAFLSNFDNYDYQVENDEILVVKDGKRIEDKLGNPLKFDDFVKSEATNYFEFMAQPARGGAGNGSGATPSGGALSIPMPKTVEEFNEQRAKLSGKELVEYATAAREHLRSNGAKI